MSNNNYISPTESGTKKWYKKGWGIAIIIFVGLIIILIGLLIGAIIMTTRNASSDIPFLSSDDPKNPQRLLLEDINNPYAGNIDSKIVIVEFSDFSCSACQAEFPIIREVINKYKNDILYIYRQFPLISEESYSLSHASLCANEQGKFWQMHDQLFLNLDYGIDELAKRSSLELAQFNQCINSDKYRDQIIADVQLATNLEVEGTPTFFINGNKIAGVITLSQWTGIIDKALELYSQQ